MWPRLANLHWSLPVIFARLQCERKSLLATHDKFDPDWKQVDPEDEDKEYLTPNEASSFIGTEVVFRG